MKSLQRRSAKALKKWRFFWMKYDQNERLLFLRGIEKVKLFEIYYKKTFLKKVIENIVLICLTQRFYWNSLFIKGAIIISKFIIQWSSNPLCMHSTRARYGNWCDLSIYFERRFKDINFFEYNLSFPMKFKSIVHAFHVSTLWKLVRFKHLLRKKIQRYQFFRV